MPIVRRANARRSVNAQMAGVHGTAMIDSVVVLRAGTPASFHCRDDLARTVARRSHLVVRLTSLTDDSRSVLPCLRSTSSAIRAGRDVLVRLRTGGGKSLLYQLPTLLDEPGSLTLVFSPLRALQRDQVQALERRGVHAALLNSDLSTSMHADILRDFAVNGGLLYLAPEQLRREDVRTVLAAAHVRRVVVDEAHILPQVEHAFRKDYRRIGPFIESLPEHPQVLAFTATATRSDLSYIAERLCMRDPKRLLFPIARKNIKLYIKKITVQGKTRKTRKLQNARLRLLDNVLRKYRKARCHDHLLPTRPGCQAHHQMIHTRSRDYPVKLITGGKMKRCKRARTCRTTF